MTRTRGDDSSVSVLSSSGSGVGDDGVAVSVSLLGGVVVGDVEDVGDVVSCGGTCVDVSRIGTVVVCCGTMTARVVADSRRVVDGGAGANVIGDAVTVLGAAIDACDSEDVANPSAMYAPSAIANGDPISDHMATICRSRTHHFLARGRGSGRRCGKGDVDVIEVVCGDTATILHRLPAATHVDPLAPDHV